VWCSFLFDSKS